MVSSGVGARKEGNGELGLWGWGWGEDGVLKGVTKEGNGEFWGWGVLKGGNKGMEW